MRSDAETMWCQSCDRDVRVRNGYECPECGADLGPDDEDTEDMS